VEKLRAKMAGSKPMITKESHRNVQAKFSYDGSVYAELTGKEYREVGEVVREIGEEYLVHCKLSFIA
jgi:dihydroflavonol-4-reductase